MISRKTFHDTLKTGFIHLHHMSKIVIVEGIQGAGKSVFCKSCVNVFPDAVLMEEWVDEPYLAAYLADMENLASEFQTRAQNETVAKLRQARNLVKQGKTVFLDRGVIGNTCFAEVQHELGYISDSQLETYQANFDYETIVKELDVPVETWYLRCDPKVALQRIFTRDRGGEDVYTLEYLQDLQARHDRLLRSSQNLKIVNVSENQNLSNGLLSSSYVESVISQTSKAQTLKVC